MFENVIVIQAVANGYIVTLPKTEPNQYEMIGKGIQQFMPTHDPMLTGKKEELQENEIKKTEHVHIFDSFEKVLVFLTTLEV